MTMINIQKTIPKLQHKIKMIYGEQNKKKGMDYLFGYMVKNYLRPRASEKISHIFIKSLSYLFALANLFDIDIQESFLKKYPEICPYCFSAPCKCILTGKKSSLRLSLAKEAEELKSRYDNIKNVHQEGMFFTFEQIFSIIQRTYPSNSYDWKNHGYYLHMVKGAEEIAELYEVLCRLIKYGKDNKITRECACDEIADVFAWMISEWGLWTNNTGMSDSFFDFYREGCSSCHKGQCRCADRSERDTLLTADDSREKVIDLINLIIGDEELIKQFDKKTLMYHIERLQEAATQRHIDTCTNDALLLLQNHLRRSTVPSEKTKKIYDQIGLIETVLSPDYRYK